MVNNFSKHLSDVYSLEMFYGDETLKSLMDHSSQLSERLSNIDLILNENEEEDSIAEKEA